jgi:hypothetical protein
MKRFVTSYLAFIAFIVPKFVSVVVALLIASQLLVPSAVGQELGPTSGPEQDCVGGLTVSRNVILHPSRYAGAGAGNDVPNGFACARTDELASTWYRLVVGANGTLAFTITPLLNDDFNFIVFRSPAGVSQQNGCNFISSNVSSSVRCNFASNAGFPTGLDATITGTTFDVPIPVTQGEIYFIYITNSTGRGGFTLNFSNSSPGVIPGVTAQAVRPVVSLRANQAAQAVGCGAANSLTITYSQPVLRTSVQPSSFTLTGPNNTPIAITSVALATPVPTTNVGPVSFVLTLAKPIEASGTYTLSSNATTGVIVRDLVNSPVAMPPISLRINIGQALPVIVPDPPPVNTNASAVVSFCLGKTAKLTAEDAGPGSQYQWIREGDEGMQIVMPDRTNRTLEISGEYAGGNSVNDTTITTSQTVRFKVRITDASGCVRTSTSVSVRAAPGAQAQVLVNGMELPFGFRFCRNEGITLEAQAGFQSYLWYVNGRAIDTATKRFFFVRDQGSISVETFDATGCQNRSREIPISPFDVTAPIISGNNVNCPDAITGTIDVPITLRSTTDPSYLSYQWLNSAGAPIRNATSATFPATSGTFSVRITTRECTATSAAFTIRAGIRPRKPVVNNLIDGVPITLCPGESYPLDAGADFPSYQWYFNERKIDGAVQRRYIATMPGRYAVQVFTVDKCPSELSSPPVTLTSSGLVPVFVTSSSNSLTTCVGTALRLSVNQGDNFEWLFNGRVIGTNREIQVAGAFAAGRYDFQVKVSFEDITKCNLTTTITVTVTGNPRPIIVTPSGGRSFCQGGSLVLDAGDNYSGYEWFNGTNAIPAPAGTQRSITVRAAGTYSVRVRVSENCVGASDGVVITELASPASPEIESVSGNFNVCPNGSLTLRVRNVVAGLSYQWFRGMDTLRGETQPTLVVLTPGAYTVEARNASGCTSRPNAPTNVGSATAPTPPILPATLTICPNDPKRITAAAGFASYQWLENGQPTNLLGATTRELTVSRSGLFSVRVTNTDGCASTSANVVVIQTPPIVTIALLNGGVRFAARSIPQGREFRWIRNGLNVPGAIDSIYAPDSEGTYNVRVTDINGCSDTAQTPRQFTLPRVDLIPIGRVTGATQTIDASVVRADTLSASPGDTVQFSLGLLSFGTLSTGATLSANMCFNATLLEPLPPLARGTIVNGIRCIPVNFVLPANTQRLVLDGLFRAALGNDTATYVSFQNIRLQPDGAVVSPTSSFFRLDNVSYAGGVRLIGSPPRVRLVPPFTLRPNPVDGDEVILGYIREDLQNSGSASASTGEALDAIITISDVYGRTLQQLPPSKLAGKTGEVRLNVQGIPTGVYFVTVRTKDGVRAERIHIIR